MPIYTNTVKHALRRLTGTNVISDIDAGIAALADDIDAKMAIADAGTLASRPVSTAGTPGKLGRFYRVTDQANRIDFDYGFGWITVAALTDGVLSAAGGLHAKPYNGGVGGAAYALVLAGEPEYRFYVRGDGLLYWGGGTAAPDVYLHRSAAGVLKTDGKLWVGGDNVWVQGAGGLYLGDAADVRLYRSAADTLKTDDALEVAGALTKGGTAVALTNDARLSDQDAAAGTPSRRTLGTGATQAAAGNDARLSDQRAPKGPETNLKIIRGNVTSAGAIQNGSGFTVARTALGRYTISFSTAFSSPPAVTVSAVGLNGDIADVGAFPLAGSATVAVLNLLSGVANSVDSAFSFVAIGPA